MSMSAIREKQSQVWYVDLSHQGMRRRLKSPENSKKGAQAYELVLRQRIARGEDFALMGQKAKTKDRVEKEQEEKEANKKQTLYQNFVEEWMLTYVKNNNKPSEQEKKACVLKNHLLPFFGKKRLNEINAQLIEQYKTKKLNQFSRSGKPLSCKTINNQITILRASLASACEWNYLEHIPQVKWLKTQAPAVIFLSRNEVEKILNYDESLLWSTMILLALRTGMRIGEILGLHWEDIDFETGLLTVRRNLSGNVLVTPKSNRMRCFPVPTEVIMSLHVWSQYKNTKTGFVFTDESGNHLSRFMADYWLKKICKEVGIKPYSCHKLRHTFATHAASQGAPLRDVQHVLGHSTIQMTEKYAHVTDESLRHTMNLLGGQPIDLRQYIGSTQNELLAPVRSWSHGQDDNLAESKQKTDSL